MPVGTAALGAISDLALAGFKIGTGISQRQQGREMEPQARKEKEAYRNQYNTKAALSRYLLSRRAPGYDNAKANINQAGSNAYQQLQSSAGSAADVIAGLNKIQGNQNQALQDLSLQSAQRYDQSAQNYGADLGMLAQVKQQEYAETASAIAALYSGGTQNIGGGLKDVSQTVANVGNLFPGGGNGGNAG